MATAHRTKSIYITRMTQGSFLKQNHESQWRQIVFYRFKYSALLKCIKTASVLKKFLLNVQTSSQLIQSHWSNNFSFGLLWKKLCKRYFLLRHSKSIRTLYLYMRGFYMNAVCLIVYANAIEKTLAGTAVLWRDKRALEHKIT